MENKLWLREDRWIIQTEIVRCCSQGGTRVKKEVDMELNGGWWLCGLQLMMDSVYAVLPISWWAQKFGEIWKQHNSTNTSQKGCWFNQEHLVCESAMWTLFRMAGDATMFMHTSLGQDWKGVRVYTVICFHKISTEVLLVSLLVGCWQMKKKYLRTIISYWNL